MDVDDVINSHVSTEDFLLNRNLLFDARSEHY